MPNNVFGNSSKISEHKIGTSLFVQEPYLKHNYIEAKIEEDIDLKNQYRIKNLPDPIHIREPASKHYVDDLFNDPCIIKNTEYIDGNDRNITNAQFIQVNQLPQIDSHLTAKLYVDNAIDEISLVKNNQDNDFNNNNLTNINSITLNTQEVNDNQVITKAYVDQFHQENERSRRDLGIDFSNESDDIVKNIQDNDLNDNKITNLDFITINRNPTSDNGTTNKKYVDDELDKNTILRFNQTLQNYLKISVGNDTNNLTDYIKIPLSDTTIMKAGNTGGYLLLNWKNICNDRNDSGKIQICLKSTKTNSPTASSGATSLPPIGSAFIYIETSSNNNGKIDYVTLVRINIIQNTNITFYYNRFSTSDKNLRGMGRFRIQFLLEDNTWSTQYTIA